MFSLILSLKSPDFIFYKRSSKSASVCWTLRILTGKQMQLVLTVTFLLCTTVSTPPIFLVYPTSKSPVSCRHCLQETNKFGEKFKYVQFLYVLTALAGALFKPVPQVDPACRQLHSVILAGILLSWKESNLSMAQPQVPKTCSFEKTLETLAVASKKISTFPTHIFEESASKGFLSGLYILLTDLPRVSRHFN